MTLMAIGYLFPLAIIIRLKIKGASVISIQKLLN